MRRKYFSRFFKTLNYISNKNSDMQAGVGRTPSKFFELHFFSQSLAARPANQTWKSWNEKFLIAVIMLLSLT